MDEIQHKYIEARGVKLHIAETGTGSSIAVVFLHGFPEIWYSWRHQMIALARAGFHAIAPDLRGYGLSDPPPQLDKASFNDFVEDTIAILDSSNIDKAFLVGKDFGAWPAYLISLYHPTRVRGIVSLGVPFPPDPRRYSSLPQGFYISRWKEPGRAEADFGRFDVKTVVRKIYILFSRSEIPIAEDDHQEIMDLVDPATPLPPWFSEEDLEAYATLYQRSGFNAPMQVPYKGLRHEKIKESPRIEAPVLLVMGEKDYFMKFPGIEEYVKSGKVNEYVPDLDIKFLPHGTHFMQEQFPDHINHLIITFLNDHVSSV